MDTARPAAAALASFDDALRIELIERPREIPPERTEGLNTEVADLAWRACGGPDTYDDLTVRDGWRAYFFSPGGRVEDHDRVVLVWDEDKLVSFNGLMVETMEPGDTLLWYRAAGTDPEYQARGAFT